MARQIDSSWDEACALADLGRCARAADAAAGLRQALEIFHRIGEAETAGVATELDALTGAAPAAPKGPERARYRDQRRAVRR